MYSRAFVAVANSSFFPGLWALLNSIYAYYECEYRVFVVAHEMASNEAAALHSHPLGAAITVLDSADFARRPAGAWEAKQMVLSELAGAVENVCLLDADLILLSRLDDVFGWSDEGLIVSSQDGLRDYSFGDQYRSYGPRVVGAGLPYFNSGFLCLNLIRHWDLAALWEFTARFAGYSPSGGPPYHFAGHGDQGLLNALAVLLSKKGDLKLLPQETWCNSAGWSSSKTVDLLRSDGNQLHVVHRHSGEHQRLLHSTGPKWWTDEGKAHFSQSGDVLKCFDHFNNLHPLVGTVEELVQIPEATNRSIDKFDGPIQMADLRKRLGMTNPRILELGSHDGTDTLALLQAFPEAIVDCFECDPRPIVRFQERLSQEGATERVTLNQVAIADTCGERDYYQSHGHISPTHPIKDWDYSSSILQPTGHLNDFPWCRFDPPTKVSALTLDAWLGNLSAPQPRVIDLIWADVQGAEHLMIRGGREVLLRTRYLYCEFYNSPMYDGQLNLSELQELLGSQWEVIAIYDGYNFLAFNHGL